MKSITTASWKLTLHLRKLATIFLKAKQYATKYLKPKSVSHDDMDMSSLPKVKFSTIQETYYKFENKDQLRSAKLKPIAFYLPQFHPFKENDEWWGKGFTEWSNVTKAKKNFPGHYQPHLPIHLGFYDLRIKQNMVEQVKLAKNYGIYGFNFYFYWFAGATLMEAPLKMLLREEDIHMPFCLTWANENWTRTWDGSEKDVLIEQKHSKDDHRKFIEHLQKYFKDERYIKIDEKPVLIIYRVDIIPSIKEAVKIWRDVTIQNGFPDLYLICAQTFGTDNPKPFGFDAAMEFPPHTIKSGEVSYQYEGINPDFEGQIYCYEQVVKYAVQSHFQSFKKFPTAMLGWDNTARKQNTAHIFTRFSLTLYSQWLDYISNWVYHDENFSENEKLIFINAWNEWAEGTHLEPDRKYGFGYLATTHNVLMNYSSSVYSHRIDEFKNKSSNTAIILHLYYEDTVFDSAQYLEPHYDAGVDIFVTSSKSSILDSLKQKMPNINTLLVENRGRDVLPFIRILNYLNTHKYDVVFKLHGKKSEYRLDGDENRKNSMEKLLGDPYFSSICNEFLKDINLGLVYPLKSYLKFNDKNMFFNNSRTIELARNMDIKFEFNSFFCAGSMFCARVDALVDLLKISSFEFELESGLSDGTSAHAVERLFVQCVIAKGLTTRACEDITFEN